MLLPNSTGKNQFASGPLRFNESHISLLSTVHRGQLTSILRAKKPDHRRYDSTEGYRLRDVAYRKKNAFQAYLIRLKRYIRILQTNFAVN